MTPKEAALKIFSEMTQEEKDTANRYGANDMEDRAREYAHGPGVVYPRRFVEDVLVEIDHLCGYMGW